jgi:sensor histidine kinase regulating citrate/malate metabolism
MLSGVFFMPIVIFITDDLIIITFLVNIFSNLAIFLFARTKFLNGTIKRTVLPTNKLLQSLTIAVVCVIFLWYFLFLNTEYCGERAADNIGVLVIALVLTFSIIFAIHEIQKFLVIYNEYIRIRKKEHDFGNIIHSIGLMCSTNSSIEDIKKYIAAQSDYYNGDKVGAASALGDSEAEVSLGNEVVDSFVESKMAKARSFGVGFIVKADSELKLPIDDSVRVLGNLIDNAIEACIGRDNATIVLLSNEHGFSVKDNGKDIPFFDRGRVFNIGYSSKKGVANGFGLANVKEVVQRNGCTIRLDVKGGEKAFEVRYGEDER